jgi:NUAK family SNF1-like kinase
MKSQNTNITNTSNFGSHGLCNLSITEKAGKKIFTKTYKAKDQTVALKEVFINERIRRFKKKNMKERSNFVVNYLGSSVNESNQTSLNFEFSPIGNLFDYFEKEIRKNENRLHLVKKLLRQVVKALIFLHRQGIIHNDVKLENIILFQDEKREITAKLGDFNNSLLYDGEEIHNLFYDEYDSTTSSLVPFSFESPTYNYDYLSLGIMIYQLFLVRTPFESKSQFEMVRKLKNKEYKQDEEYKRLDPTLRDLLEKLLEYDPEERLGDDHILLHPFFKCQESRTNNRKRIRLVNRL